MALPVMPAIALYRSRPHAEGEGSSSRTRSSSSGSTPTGVVTLGDEALTPDSSRYWSADGVRAGRIAAVVRQAVRARLVSRDRVGPHGAWPGLPDDVVAGTARDTSRRSSG